MNSCMSELRILNDKNLRVTIKGNILLEIIPGFVNGLENFPWSYTIHIFIVHYVSPPCLFLHPDL